MVCLTTKHFFAGLYFLTGVTIGGPIVLSGQGHGGGEDRKKMALPQTKKKGKKGGSKAHKAKRLKVNLAPVRKGEVWPPAGFKEDSAPPIV